MNKRKYKSPSVFDSSKRIVASSPLLVGGAVIAAVGAFTEASGFSYQTIKSLVVLDNN